MRVWCAQIKIVIVKGACMCMGNGEQEAQYIQVALKYKVA